MKTHDEITPFSERKVVRRGMLAGLAGLGAAAMMKLTGTQTAEAALTNLTYPGAGGDVATHTAAAITTWQSSPPGGSGYTVLKVQNFRIADAIEAIGGPGSLGNVGGSGLVATGGANPSGSNALPTNAGNAIEATGGATTGAGVGNGGRGVSATGGASSNATGGEGVRGTGGSPGGIGVRGFGGGTSGSQGSGVSGSTNSTNAGVQGTNTGSGAGVSGQANSTTSGGVSGTNLGTGPGVRGVASNGIGVLGISDAQPGVSGQSASSPGVDGVSTNSLGIRGTSTNFVGIVGISTNNHGLYGSAASAAGIGIVAENTAGGMGLLVTGNAQVFGSFQVFGAKNAIIKMQDGTNAAVYCQESPEPYFEDFGRGQLVGGVANVQLESEFASLVGGGDYMVFITEEGPSGHLYISRRNPGGFEVREADNGKSSISFTYRVVTRRKDIEGKRFARVSDDARKSAAAARSAIERTPRPLVSPPGLDLPAPQPSVPGQGHP